MSNLSEFIKKTIIDSGQILKEGFGKNFKIDNKVGNNNLVTEYDFKSEKFIINQIQYYFPDHSIISEEEGNITGKSNYTWIIDPLDGTVNFANNIPIFSISIALLEKNKIIFGAIYNPILDEYFFAEKGKGAYLNDKRIKVSEQNDLLSSLIVTGFPYDIDKNSDEIFKPFLNLVSKGVPVRRLGSAALDLAYVACGRFDAFWEADLKSWDVAAGILIVNEANGKVTNYSGKDSFPDDKQIIATNSHLHEELIKAINEKD